MTVNSDFQFSYNGFSFGAGTATQIISSTGLESLPDIRNPVIARSRDYGDYQGINRPASRPVTFSILQFGADSAEYAAMKIATVPRDDDLPLTFQLPGFGTTPKRLNCRPAKRITVVDENYSSDYIVTDLMFYAADPLIYEDSASVLVLNLPTGGGGLQFPVQFPADFGTSVGSGSGYATNAGDYPTRPVAVITGPCTNPRIEDVTAGQTVEFDLTLGSTDSLTIDFDQKSVLLNGTASRRGTMTPTSSWFDLQPGLTELRYRAASFVPSSSATLTWRSANI